MPSDLPRDLHERSLALHLTSAALLRTSARLRAEANRLIREGRTQRDHIRQLLTPRPPTSTA